LDHNKTRLPRTWALGADVVRALARWRELRGDEDPRVFNLARVNNEAETFRVHLRLAGVDRPELFKTTTARKHVVAHSTRNSFITLALASGRTETWVADRTGHTSSVTINLYRQAARTAEELRLGWFAPLDTAIPELAKGADALSGSHGGGTESQTNRKRNRGKELHESSKRQVQKRNPFHGGPRLDTSCRRVAHAFTNPNQHDLSESDDAGNVGSVPCSGAVCCSLPPFAVTGDRAQLVAQLAGSVASLATAGDLAGARVAADAMRRLLEGGDGALVVDIGAERRRRGGDGPTGRR
jgi:hypothetical protein